MKRIGGGWRCPCRMSVSAKQANWARRQRRPWWRSGGRPGSPPAGVALNSSFAHRTGICHGDGLPVLRRGGPPAAELIEKQLSGRDFPALVPWVFARTGGTGKKHSSHLSARLSPHRAVSVVICSPVGYVFSCALMGVFPDRKPCTRDGERLYVGPEYVQGELRRVRGPACSGNGGNWLVRLARAAAGARLGEGRGGGAFGGPVCIQDSGRGNQGTLGVRGGGYGPGAMGTSPRGCSAVPGAGFGSMLGQKQPP